MHINFHQFKLQFKTITFLATFGLLISMFTIGFAIAYFTNLPLGVGLLFGAMISATDPIAVLALFKHLGAPKRLGLLAEGESMFNDATAVITFRLIASFVVANQYFETQKLLHGAFEFVFVFIGSIIIGLIFAYLTSLIIARIKEDRATETTLTLALALGSFTLAEHYLHLSGVIATVIAGITMGNLGKTKISASVTHFLEEMWEYLSFLSISLIFFFTAFNLNFEIFKNPIHIATIVAIVLIARTLSIYLSFFFTNTLPFFKNEPNVLMSWQHIINWGGLRGVIPLVLVFSLPDTFPYKDGILSLAFATFLFTLFVNGITIKWLLTKLKLHIPAKEELIIKQEHNILELNLARQKLKTLTSDEFDPKIIKSIDQQLKSQEQENYQKLLKYASKTELVKSLQLESLDIEKKTYVDLFYQNHISENILFQLEAEIDLQEDALKYPNVYKGRGFSSGGKIDTTSTFKNRLHHLTQFISRHKLLGFIARKSEETLVYDRFTFLKARIIASYKVLEYLKHLQKIFKDDKTKSAITTVKKDHKKYIKLNQQKADQLSQKYPHILEKHQQATIKSLIHST